MGLFDIFRNKPKTEEEKLELQKDLEKKLKVL